MDEQARELWLEARRTIAEHETRASEQQIQLQHHTAILEQLTVRRRDTTEEIQKEKAQLLSIQADNNKLRCDILAAQKAAKAASQEASRLTMQHDCAKKQLAALQAELAESRLTLSKHLEEQQAIAEQYKEHVRQAQQSLQSQERLNVSC